MDAEEPVLPPPEPCPDCGFEPDGDTLHKKGCRRIGAGPMQWGSPWLAWPEDVV